MNATETAAASAAVTEHGRHSATAEPPSGGAEVPDDVVDALLWRDAQYVLERHKPDGACCGYCGEPTPCTATRLANRAVGAARTAPRVTVGAGQWRVVAGIPGGTAAPSRP